MNASKYFILITLFMMVSCAALTPSDKQSLDPELLPNTTPKQFVSRQILVTLASKDKNRWQALEHELLRDYPLSKTGAFPLQSLDIQCLVFQIPEQNDPVQLIAQLSRDKRVESVQQNKFFHNQSSAYSDQYAELQHGVESVGAHKVHHRFTGKGVKIAIIDTGIDVHHPDLAKQVKLQKTFVENGDESYVSDRHGTAVAGVIAAIADNGIGIYGVAPEAELFGLKSCAYQDGKQTIATCSSWTIAKALDFAILESVDVINFSLSGPDDNLLERLIEAAHKKNVILVAATDDRNHQMGFPASLPQVIGVVASEDPEAMHLKKIGRSHKILLAPGQDIVSTAPHSRYDFFSGSSLATAIVSGSIALLKQKTTQLSVDEIYRLLSDSETMNVCSALSAGC